MQVLPTIVFRKILWGVTYYFSLNILLWGTYSSLITTSNLGLLCSLLIPKFLIILETLVFIATDTVQLSITSFAPLVPPS